MSEGMHSTLRAMLSMYSNITQDNWVELSSFIQPARNTCSVRYIRNAIISIVWETGTVADRYNFSIPHSGGHADTMTFFRATHENQQLAFELARQNPTERSERS